MINSGKSLVVSNFPHLPGFGPLRLWVYKSFICFLWSIPHHSFIADVVGSLLDFMVWDIITVSL